MAYSSIIVWSVIGLVVLWVIATYNSMVKKNKLAEEAWHGIDVQLKRRFDLIPSLVETVKGYASHETSTLEKVVAMRSSIGQGSPTAEQMRTENQLSQTLKSIFALSESYPELKANTNFLELQKSLGEIEDTLQNARRYYNATVRDYNTLLAIFPSNIIAGIFKFREREYFATDSAEERRNVKVSFQ